MHLTLAQNCNQQPPGCQGGPVCVPMDERGKERDRLLLEGPVDVAPRVEDVDAVAESRDHLLQQELLGKADHALVEQHELTHHELVHRVVVVGQRPRKQHLEPGRREQGWRPSPLLSGGLGEFTEESQDLRHQAVPTGLEDVAGKVFQRLVDLPESLPCNIKVRSSSTSLRLELLVGLGGAERFADRCLQQESRLFSQVRILLEGIEQTLLNELDSKSLVVAFPRSEAPMVKQQLVEGHNEV
mmetsp:Transcript_36000/g.116467  ORF Transcript_36000/g.116467 Transcript_36000/m.116467 type:complete len:242 (+) Transcript_36000:3630-4355(+)